MILWRWFLHFTGADNVSGPWYGFWSGFGGGSPFLGGLILYARRHNCHHHRCWRLARHPVPGTGYVTCRKHHPTIDGKPTWQNIASAHAAANGIDPEQTTAV